METNYVICKDGNNEFFFKQIEEKGIVWTKNLNSALKVDYQTGNIISRLIDFYSQSYQPIITNWHDLT